MNRPGNGVLNYITRILSEIFQWNSVFALSYSTGYFRIEIISSSLLKTILRCECFAYFIKLDVDYFGTHSIVLESYFAIFFFLVSLCPLLLFSSFVPITSSFLRKVFFRKKRLMLCVIVYVIFHVNDHIYVDFLHKYERMNEHPRICKQIQKWELALNWESRESKC